MPYNWGVCCVPDVQTVNRVESLLALLSRDGLEYCVLGAGCSSSGSPTSATKLAGWSVGCIVAAVRFDVQNVANLTTCAAMLGDCFAPVTEKQVQKLWVKQHCNVSEQALQWVREQNRIKFTLDQQQQQSQDGFAVRRQRLRLQPDLVARNKKRTAKRTQKRSQQRLQICAQQVTKFFMFKLVDAIGAFEALTSFHFRQAAEVKLQYTNSPLYFTPHLKGRLSQDGEEYVAVCAPGYNAAQQPEVLQSLSEVDSDPLTSMCKVTQYSAKKHDEVYTLQVWARLIKSSSIGAQQLQQRIADASKYTEALQGRFDDSEIGNLHNAFLLLQNPMHVNTARAEYNKQLRLG